MVSHCSCYPWKGAVAPAPKKLHRRLASRSLAPVSEALPQPTF
ncbi:MAG: hypothetical protein ACK559_41875 [bacterium]